MREREKPTLIQSDIMVFKTPICDFYIRDGIKGAVTFDVLHLPKKMVYVKAACDENEEIAAELDGNYGIRIATEKLELKKPYYMHFTRRLSYLDADERLFTYGITNETSALAISFPNPNDDKKCRGCSECDYEGFDISEENGDFVLRVFNRTEDSIYIAMAWLINAGADTASCESAVTAATWWI